MAACGIFCSLACPLRGGLVPMAAVSSYSMNASQVVDELLDQTVRFSMALLEASVYLPPRSTKWVAVYTGVEPGRQARRSTGLTDREAAMILARKWEREARQERARSKVPFKTRVPGRAGQPGVLSQKEVAAVLGMTERGVRAAEHRALAKLRKDPTLRQIWNLYKH